MKKYIVKYLILIFTVLLFSSCIAVEYVSDIVEKEAIVNSENKKIIVSVLDSITIKNFDKTFDKSYRETYDFAKEYAKGVSSGLDIKGFSSKIFTDEVDKWSLLNKGSDAENTAKINLLMEGAGADYLIVINNIIVTSRYESVNIPKEGFDNFGGGGSYNNKEFCVIKAKVIVFNLKSKKEIMSFVSTGESAVSVLNFTKTLNRAREKSVNHIVNYLTTGRVQYKKKY